MSTHGRTVIVATLLIAVLAAGTAFAAALEEVRPLNPYDMARAGLKNTNLLR